MQRPLKIAIGVCTRGRPDGLTALLDSYASLQIPGGYDPIFLIIENNGTKTLQSCVEGFRQKRIDAEIIYELEPRLGIPFARNALLDTAVKNDCRFLAMADDDEIVEPNWLRALHEELVTRGLELVGGPVRILPAQPGATWSEQWIWRGLRHRFLQLEAKAQKKYKHGHDHRVVIITSSWLVSLDFVRAQGLRFDDTLGLSGGSDTRFFRQFIACQGRSGWAPRAIVHEHWPRERLRPSYQFYRARDQAISHFRNSFRKVSFAVVIQSMLFVIFKLFSCLWLFPAAVCDGGKSSVHAFRALGFAMGRISALLGAHSRQYATAGAAITGHHRGRQAP